MEATVIVRVGDEAMLRVCGFIRVHCYDGVIVFVGLFFKV